MPPQANAATLNVQPRQRRGVYEALASLETGMSVTALLGTIEMPEAELREALRKLDAAGLVRRTKGAWSAVPLAPEPESSGSDADPETSSEASS